MQDKMNRTQNNVTEIDSLAHVKDTVSKKEVPLTNVVEDANTAQPEANIQRTEVDNIITHTQEWRAHGKRVRDTQKVAKKRPASPT